MLYPTPQCGHCIIIIYYYTYYLHCFGSLCLSLYYTFCHSKEWSYDPGKLFYNVDLKSIRVHLPTEVVAVECDYVVVHH